MPAMFVNDGYTIKETIKARVGYWDEDIVVEFRPPVADEMERLVGQKTDGSAFLASKLISWSGNGLEKSQPDLALIKILWSPVWTAILNAVCHYKLEDDLKN